MHTNEGSEWHRQVLYCGYNDVENQQTEVDLSSVSGRTSMHSTSMHVDTILYKDCKKVMSVCS